MQRRDRRVAPRGGRRPYDVPGRFPNLLIADSYEGARVPCARYLDHFGFHVEQATDGDDAFMTIRSTPVHLLLVEASLPKMSAQALADWLGREVPSRIPVILMLSDFDAEGVRQLPQSAAVLIKPFPLATMLQEVRRALRMTGSIALV
jgi:DNA-binding response OmpR family regulator